MQRLIIGGTALALLGGAATAHGENMFEYAFQGVFRARGPYSLNETFTLGTLGNVYAG